MNQLDPSELNRLRAELEEENLKRQGLETAIVDLEEGLQTRKHPDSDTTSSNEWKLKYEAQLQHNKELEQQAADLREQLGKAQERLKAAPQATVPYPELSEADVKKLLKKLEREKVDVQRQLNDLEWRLDNQSKAFHKADEERSNLTTQLRSVTKAVEGISLGQHAGRGSITKQVGTQPAAYLPLARGGKKTTMQGSQGEKANSEGAASTSENPMDKVPIGSLPADTESRTGLPNPTSPEGKNSSERTRLNQAVMHQAKK